MTTGKDGSIRIVDEAGTSTVKHRDGEGIVCEVSTGCRDEDGINRDAACELGDQLTVSDSGGF
ncbi:MAG: hypothetical protein NT138_18730 [Planctomycetales bacterium]|nr:hypothetical protein [Planctomycetales bacterium]